MKLLCECNSFGCDKSVDISPDDFQAIRKQKGAVVIVEGCPKGPDDTDVFIEKRTGYSIYKE